MAYRQMHLNKSGSGMTSKTACGRNRVNTPMAADWEQFKNLPEEDKCARCAASKQAELNARKDAEEWEPEDADAWKKADDALIAKNKKK